MYKKEISPSAERDIGGIWDYTIDNYGIKQARKYTNGIGFLIDKICNKTISVYSYYKNRQFPKFVRYEHHFIFYTLVENTVVVIAVFHNQMNIIAKLENRLHYLEKTKG